jgi:hypothetical protein
MSKRPLLFALMIVASSNVSAQFTFSGELRPRLELRDGYRTLPAANSEMAAFVNQRSRLNLLYESDHFNTFVSFQDVRTWGQKGMFEVEPGMGIHQAYAEIFFAESFSFKAGRQELRYNNQRLFGVNNWNQNGRTHDAAVFKFEPKGLKIHLGSAFNQSTENLYGTEYTGKEYKSLNFLWAEKVIGQFNISGIAIADGYQGTVADSSTQFRTTFGSVLSWKPGKHSFEIHAYKQMGINPDQQKIDAWYLHIAGRLTPAVKFNLNLGAEFMSGNDQSKSETSYKSFNTLYGANHAFNGHLDYFTNIPAHSKEAGLVNPYINVVYRIKDDLNIKADYHYFGLQGNLVDENNDAIAKYLGSEIDLSMQYFISKQADLQLGYSTLFATESMEFLKGGSHKEPIHWAWVMLTVKPVFFTTKN